MPGNTMLELKMEKILVETISLNELIKENFNE